MSIVPFLNKINALILNPLLSLMFFVAFLIFIWGIVLFVAGAAEDKKREEGKKAMMYSLIGMFIMIAVYGIIRFVLNTFGISTDVYPLKP